MSTCSGWLDEHDCGLPEGHAGDHVCKGCADLWNQGPWDYDDDLDHWTARRSAERCTDYDGVDSPGVDAQARL